MSPKDHLPITLRPARSEDTPDVLELTSHIWEGDDYIPEVWPEWLEDQAGLLLVAEHQGRVVGLAKLSETTPKDWWMQGLRVHPEFEGHGIASRLHEALLDYWQAHGQGAVRLTTHFERFQVQHLCQRCGFEKVGQYSYYQAASLGDTEAEFSPVTQPEAGEALEYAQNSPLQEMTLPYMDLGWEWLPPRLAKITEIIRRGQGLWWQGRRGMLMFNEDVEEDEQKRPVCSLAWIACSPEKLIDLLHDYRCLAGQRGFANAGWSAPLQENLLPILAGAGFERKWNGAVFLYEKIHPAGEL